MNFLEIIESDKMGPSMLRHCFTFTVLAVMLIGSMGVCHADIILTGDFNGDGNPLGGVGTPTLTITNDLIFTITANGSVSALIFDEWTTNDSSATDSPDVPAQSLAFELNGNPQTRNVNILRDNYSNNTANVSANDGYILLSTVVAVTTGDIFTVKAGSYTFTQRSAFNPLLENFTFTGNVFLTDQFGVELSNSISAASPAAVPEPGSLALVSLIGVGFGVSRFRRKRKPAA